MSVAMTSNRSRTPGWVKGALSLGALGLLAGGGWLYYRGHARSLKHEVRVLTGQHTVKIPTAVLERLRARHPNVTADAAVLVQKGRTQLVDDRAASYEEARALFEQALVRDPHNADAAWGLAEAVALGSPQDTSALADAFALLDGVRQTARVKVGRAELLLAQGGEGADEKARALVQEALPHLNGEDAGFAHLALGRTYSRNSVKLAIAAFDQALKESGRLVRSYTLRGVAKASAGDYTGALSDLQQRLALDRNHWPTLDALGRIDLEVGQVTQARQLCVRAREAAPSDLRPAIALAQVRYQAEGKT
jgi:tetratricopeptide (TPR) repeat protein